jgi:hypothetical protein
VLVADNLHQHAALLDGAVITQTTRFFATLSCSPLTQPVARIFHICLLLLLKYRGNCGLPLNLEVLRLEAKGNGELLLPLSHAAMLKLPPVLGLDLARRAAWPVVLKLLNT